MTTKPVQYGKYEEEIALDQDGSTVTRSVTIADYKETSSKKRFEVRIRVTNDKEVLAEFLKFQDEVRDMAKAEFRIDHTAAANAQGFFYVVKCWTEVASLENVI